MDTAGIVEAECIYTGDVLEHRRHLILGADGLPASIEEMHPFWGEQLL
jgi:hypothetical protein